MGKPRIEYLSGNLEFSVNREEFFIFIHYANTLSLEKARTLYFAGETDYIYRRYNDLSVVGLDYYNSHHTYLNPGDLQEVVEFLESQIIPSLEKQSNLNLIDILGGWTDLKNQIDQGPTYKKRFGVLDVENIAEDTCQYIYIADSLKEIIENSLNIGIPYEIRYDE